MGVYTEQMPCNKCNNCIIEKINSNANLKKEVIIKKQTDPIKIDEINENIQIILPNKQLDRQNSITNIENKIYPLKKQKSNTIIKSKSAINILSKTASTKCNNTPPNELEDNIIKINKNKRKNNIIIIHESNENNIKNIDKLQKSVNQNNIKDNNENKKKSYANYDISDIISEKKIHTTNNIEVVFRGYLILRRNKENNCNENLFGVLTKIKLKLYKNIQNFLAMKKPEFIIKLQTVKNVNITQDKDKNDLCLTIDDYVFKIDNQETLFKWFVVLNYFTNKFRS